MFFLKEMIWVSYAYFEASTRNIDNLNFFFKQNPPRADVKVNLVLQSECSVEIPEYVRVLKTENSGYDLGAHYKALKEYSDWKEYDYFVFLNCGQRGPFLPSYWPKDKHWSDVFVDRLKQLKTPGVCGTSIFCHPVHRKPVVETWAFCLSRSALECLLEHSQVFSVHATKYEAVVNGEDQMTSVLLEHGFDIDCLLLKYNRTQWSAQIQNCNGCKIPSRPNQYDGININPLETVFCKTFWATTDEEESNRKECEVEKKYTEWILEETLPETEWFVAPEVTMPPKVEEPEPEPEPPIDPDTRWIVLGAGVVTTALLVVLLIVLLRK